jgi:hypothetical protein
MSEEDAGSSSETRIKSIRLENDSSLEFRIFPKMLDKQKDLLEFWRTHVYEGTDYKNTSKKRWYLFLCAEQKEFNRQTSRFETIVKCPACEKSKEFKDKRLAVEAQAKAAKPPKTREQINKALEKMGIAGYFKTRFDAGKYHLYVKDRMGKRHILELGSSAGKSLKEVIKKLQEGGHTPFGRRGIWFRVTRVGNGGMMNPDKVEPVRIERPDGSSVLDFDEASNGELKSALAEFESFQAMRDRITFPFEVVEALAHSSGDPMEIPRILGYKIADDSTPDLPDESGGGEDDVSGFDFGEEKAPAPAPKPAPAPTPKQAPAPTPATDEDVDSMFD